ncbi:hypothetical protein J6Z39_08305 [bacterium]|nr:hypothetical protein [bacterium]MBR6244880.1 hypothetical protein [bacterium]
MRIKPIFLFIFVVFAVFTASGGEYFNDGNDPLAKVTDTSWGNRSRELRHAIDVQNCGKGCGALLSYNSGFVMNPAATMLEKLFSISAIYQYLDAMSVSVNDSKTTVVGGGILYSYNAGLHHIKTNFAFPIWPGFIYGGINMNNYIGDFAPRQIRNFNSHSFDIGITGNILGFVYLGFAALDVWTFAGKDVPRKLSWNVEVNIKNMIYINNGWQYHLQQKNEAYPNPRTTMKGFDFYTGIEFRHAWFRTGLGFNNIAFVKEMSWFTTTKTIFVGFYKQMLGAVYANFMYNEKKYYTFSINLIWEPSVGG